MPIDLGGMSLGDRSATYAPWSAGPAIMRDYDPSANVSLNLIVANDWVLEAAKKLESIGHRHQNWDSYGGSPLKPAAKDFTVQVLKWLNQENLPTPAVVLGSAGTVQFEWKRQGKELEVDIGEGKGIEFVVIDRNGDTHEGQEQGDSRRKLCELAAWLLRG